MYEVVISPPEFVIVNVAVPVVALLQEPATLSAGGVLGVGLAVFVASGVLDAVGVNDAVAVGLLIQDPFTFNVTKERNEVL